MLLQKARYYEKRVITESALLQKACYYGKYVITEKCVMSIISKKTIFAPITPVAMSAVGVIRISGERTFDILSEIFSKSLKDVKSHTVHHGYIKDGDKIIDDVLVAVFRSPRSYTGEDVAEISCHGSPYVLSSVQDLLLKKGAVLAKGGEFSRRAFLNGKMDVTQAEAIIDLIESESEKEASVALDEIGGTLSRKIEEIRESLLSAASHLLAYVDYPDDGIEDMSAEDLRKVIRENRVKLQSLEKSYESGKLIKNGVRVCITGKPNVGKSSLMNRLSGYERSIVANIAGTTRDVVGETVVFGGVKLRLFDTAGICRSDDEIEKLGVLKAEEEIKKADVVFCLFDVSSSLDDDDAEVLSLVEKSDAEKIAVLNKVDKQKATKDDKLFSTNAEKSELFDKKRLLSFNKTVEISAKEGFGIDDLERALKEIFEENYSFENRELIMNSRQRGCVAEAAEALSRAEENIMMTPDVLLLDIEEAIDSLSLMTGKNVSEEVLENIFSRFCVGK